MKNIRIVSDGTAAGTFVFTASGEKITGIMKTVIKPIEPGSPVIAVITIYGAELDMVANVEAE